MYVDQKSENLIHLIAEKTGIAAKRLTNNMSLFHDFGMAGDDGLELLEAIANEFEIDMKGVDSSQYFGAEAAYNPIYHFFCLLRGKKLDEDISRLEISDLKRTVEAGIWQEPN